MKLTGGGVATLLLLGGVWSATAITIDNPGFEAPDTAATDTPPDGWTVSGTGGSGVWDITTHFPGTYLPTTAPDGSSQVAYLSLGGRGTAAYLSQVLTANLEDNTLYSLSGYVGHPKGFAVGTIYEVSLYAGVNLLASQSGTGPNGDFEAFSFDFDSTGSAYVGQQLEIRLGSNKDQTVFDTIALGSEPLNGNQGPTSVPDSGLTLALLGMGMMGLGQFRRMVK